MDFAFANPLKSAAAVQVITQTNAVFLRRI